MKRKTLCYINNVTLCSHAAAIFLLETLTGKQYETTWCNCLNILKNGTEGVHESANEGKKRHRSQAGQNSAKYERSWDKCDGEAFTCMRKMTSLRKNRRQCVHVSGIRMFRQTFPSRMSSVRDKKKWRGKNLYILATAITTTPSPDTTWQRHEKCKRFKSALLACVIALALILLHRCTHT